MSSSKYYYQIWRVINSINNSYELDNHIWEPDRPSISPTPDSEDEQNGSPQPQVLGGRQAVEEALRRHVYIESFPSQGAGSAIRMDGQSTHFGYSSALPNSQNNPFAPFNDRLNWEFAKWAKLYGPGSNSLNKLLAIPGVCWYCYSVYNSWLNLCC